MNSLQQRIGSSPILKIELFTNWGRTQKAKVISCYPTSKDEIQSLVQAAGAEDVRVRCVGSRHSWAPLFSDDRQLLIYVAKMQSDYSDGSRIRLVNVSKKYLLQLSSDNMFKSKILESHIMCRKHRINCQTVKQNKKFIGLITSLKLFYCSYLRNNEVLKVCILQIISKIITFSLLVYLKCYVTQ